jgi:hypothetical protein
MHVHTQHRSTYTRMHVHTCQRVCVCLSDETAIVCMNRSSARALSHEDRRACRCLHTQASNVFRRLVLTLVKTIFLSNGYGSGLLIQSGQNKNGHLLALGSSLALVAGVRACMRLCNCVGYVYPGVFGGTCCG